jgi:hypothetical protein
MPQVLTTNATITCPHAGQGKTQPIEKLWSVQGGFVAAENDPGTLTCASTPPCVGYTLTSMGLNATTLNGRKVILATDFQKSFTGLPLTIVETHSAYDNSSPAALPAGAGSATLAPELLDVAPPIVAVVPPSAVFTSAPPPPKPPTFLLTFSLSAPYPLLWILTFINTVAGQAMDATNGIPPGIVVAPAGGSWTPSSLTVTVTITALFAVAQGIGTHEFFMTGVTKRGISAYAKALMVVS